MDKKGCFITEDPTSDKEKLMYKNKEGDRIHTMEHHESGSVVIHQYAWLRDRRYNSDKGTWYEECLRLEPDEFYGIVNYLFLLKPNK